LRVVCGLWFVCGFVVCGLWVCGLWFVVCGSVGLQPRHGLWFVVCGLWLHCGFRLVAFGSVVCGWVCQASAYRLVPGLRQGFLWLHRFGVALWFVVCGLWFVGLHCSLVSFRLTHQEPHTPAKIVFIMLFASEASYQSSSVVMSRKWPGE
jgi:hypothetical protein